MKRDEVVHNEDCAMHIGLPGRHCSGWVYETCEGCRQAKLISDGYYRVDNDRTRKDRLWIVKREVTV